MRRRAICVRRRAARCAWPAASRRACRRTSRRAISIVAALVAAALAGPLSAADVATRAAERARGTDRPTAIAVGRAVLARPLPAQVIQIRCERLGPHRICGLVLSGVKFKYPIGKRAFIAEVETVVRTAFATAPLEEVDLWTTVPLAAGKGIVVSGDLAAPTSATVFAITVPRAALARLDRDVAGGRDVFWDPAFAASLVKGDS